MEYLDGRSLDSIVREEAPLTPERAIEITEQVLRAARFAHRRGIVHRDLKPHNVIIDERGPRQGDRLRDRPRRVASEITQTGSIMGTARYLSPEQAQGEAIGPRSDLYAVGMMLYELLTGTVPFEGDSVVAIALRHLSEPPRPPSSLVPSISPNLDAIVLKALAKDPDAALRRRRRVPCRARGRARAPAGRRRRRTASLAPVAYPRRSSPALAAPTGTYRRRRRAVRRARCRVGGRRTGIRHTGERAPGGPPGPPASASAVRSGRGRCSAVIVAAAAAVAAVLLLDSSGTQRRRRRRRRRTSAASSGRTRLWPTRVCRPVVPLTERVDSHRRRTVVITRTRRAGSGLDKRLDRRDHRLERAAGPERPGAERRR